MRFEVAIKYGRNWSYKGIYQASTSRAAALDARYSWGRKVIRVRPEDSRDKWLVYRFQECDMKEIRIYLSRSERIVIYAEGGCQFESYDDRIGWVNNDNACRDWKAAITEAQAALANTLSNLELVS